MRCRIWVLFSVVLLGCPGVPEARPLVDLFGWVEARSEEDPFDGRPEEFECPPSSRVVETEDEVSFLEIDTGLCDYLTLRQDSLVEVSPGDVVSFEWGYRDLEADDEDMAMGHMAFWLDSIVIEDVEVEIPAAAESFVVEVEIDEALPAGSPVWLHLHNHGSNQWMFYAAEVRTP